MIPSELISPLDRLALFGFGLFETLLVLEKGPLFLDLHWGRMTRGAELLNLQLPNKEERTDLLQKFLRQTPDSPPYALRLTLSGGSPSAGLPAQLFFSVRPLPYFPEQYRKGISLHVLANPRNEHSPLISVKSTNYLENILAKEEAANFGADEGIWLNSQGYLAEGTMSNFFFIKNKQLFTPSLSSGCLPGTRRQLVLELAHKLDIPAEEGFYTLSDLLSADEVFMTNALMGIMPVKSAGHTVFPVSSPCSGNSVTRRLEAALKELITAVL
ncbi:aminotransferase class IV [Desulfosporosinus sp. PR]|uniref:aminotransferase class IV n=1 Tax=Candidatus Desulfosporosinus nitrosoreducens TaxID=3401928 RepID=UPI0027E6F5BB|nr:aminotransferase class IV [Desulfosporosinus sp. PR]MDQ7093953.1 aminotransferase class IV [Desulfosporosinus sp. PR]